jgi:hypothetical protein
MHDGPNYEKVIAMQYALHHYSINETFFFLKYIFFIKNIAFEKITNLGLNL